MNPLRYPVTGGRGVRMRRGQWDEKGAASDMRNYRQVGMRKFNINNKMSNFRRTYIQYCSHPSFIFAYMLAGCFFFGVTKNDEDSLPSHRLPQVHAARKVLTM